MLDEQQFVPEALVIPLSEHVEYWNGLGWHDPFSAPMFADRLTKTTETCWAACSYTPQMVADGQTEFVGSQRNIARQAIARAAVAPKVGDRRLPRPGVMVVTP